ncbi:glycosyl transferase family 1 [Capsulimonas corticalis]|uniref:Glycosyl transferase family 1 n=1 Tax=Capsulimonas corticalis TaxID=2219043 RepID=A0A402D1V4_9BACT|nr:glycosyltransferase family 4 protein [Capsulimonas corticalis]BDI28719.1 glycosyl transferase family 1 [Capsulimonas corticalis]
MKILLLIPSVLKTQTDEAVAADRHPKMDYYALADRLEALGDQVDLYDYAALDADTNTLVKSARKAGRDAGMAMAGFVRRAAYDAVFTNGENLAIPLALLFKTVSRRPWHVTIGHRLSTGKKRLFFTSIKAHQQIDRIFLYAQTQYDFARQTLGVPGAALRLIPFHADDRFYRPLSNIPVIENQISSAGLEWRDYPTLIEAVSTMPDLSVKLAASSPWSKHQNETENRTLPPNVDARRYEYGDLRTLYGQSQFVVVPLYENDFQAGVTTILEAMAMGKAVIATRTTGQTDVLIDGETGLYVAPGDVAGWREAITRLREDDALRSRLAQAGRRWLEDNATLDRWADGIAGALHDGAAAQSQSEGALAGASHRTETN